jgi:hypothetical protein
MSRAVMSRAGDQVVESTEITSVIETLNNR